MPEHILGVLQGSALRTVLYEATIIYYFLLVHYTYMLIIIILFINNGKTKTEFEFL